MQQRFDVRGELGRTFRAESAVLAGAPGGAASSHADETCGIAAPEGGEGVRVEGGRRDGAAQRSWPIGADGEIRGGWTEQMVREFGWLRFVLHALSVWDGFGPSRREFVRASGRGGWAFEKYFGGYEAFVRSGGYRPASERRMVEAAQRREAAWRGEARCQIADGEGRVWESGSARTGRGGTGFLPPSTSFKEGALKAKKSAEIVYGDRIHGCGMAHAPVNEQGVVLLFGMLAGKLGFEIEMVRTGYPDCEAKRRGKDGKWRKVLIEFEFLSSRFDHPPRGCDLVVCWEDDNNVSGLEVLELKRFVERSGDAAGAKERKK